MTIRRHLRSRYHHQPPVRVVLALAGAMLLGACAPAAPQPVGTALAPVVMITSWPTVFSTGSQVDLAQAGRLAGAVSLEIARFSLEADPNHPYELVTTVRDRDMIDRFVQLLDRDIVVGPVPACIADYELRFRRADGVVVTFGYRCGSGGGYFISGQASDGSLSVLGEVQLPDEFRPLIDAQLATAPTAAPPAAIPTAPTIAVDQAAALAAIRRLFADPSLQPAFQGVDVLINSPNADRRAAYFDDDWQRYWVDLASGQVVQVDPKSPRPDRSSPALPETELRARAEQFILRATPAFAGLEARLAYQAGSKDGVLFFYRWEDHAATGWISQPPLAQVGITLSGRVVSYLNTLFLNSSAESDATGMPR